MKPKTGTARRVERGDDFEERVQKRLAELEIEQDIIRLRNTAGLTQTELAQIAGVSQPFIAKLESGKAVNLELRTLVRIATALDAYVDTRIAKKPKSNPRMIANRRTAVMAASAGRR